MKAVINKIKRLFSKSEHKQTEQAQEKQKYTTEDVTKYYNAWTDKYLEVYGNIIQGSRPASVDELLPYLVKSIDLKDGMHLLDAGCGVCGPDIFFAQQKDLKIEAITVSDIQVQMAQQHIKEANLSDKIKVKTGDFHQLDKLYAQNTFDAVLFLESIAHAVDRKQVFAAAKEVLKPGGFVYIKDFFACDYRADEDKAARQKHFLDKVNEAYVMQLPSLMSTLDILSYLGFHIDVVQQPRFEFDPTVYQAFEKKHDIQWEIGIDIQVIATYEIKCIKPLF